MKNAFFAHDALQEHAAFPRRIVLPYPYRKISTGYEEGFTAWVKKDLQAILNRRVVDTKKVFLLLHQPESVLPPPLVTTSTTMCQIVQLNRRTLVFTIRILVLDGEAGAIESHIAEKCTSSLYKKPSISSSTTF